MKEAIEKTFRDIVRVDSISGNEAQVAAYIKERLERMGLQVKSDEIGNVVGFLPGVGEPLLLNAHMDGVPPGLGHTPIKDGDIFRTDGTTNLRADDVAGISIILEATRSIIEDKTDHPPLVLAFTAQEEIGLLGAKALDVSEYGVKRGIVFDNAFEAGTVVSRGSAYVAYDVLIKGKEGHPGKDLSTSVNALSVFLGVFTDKRVSIGESDNGQTRMNIGAIKAGDARNVVPGELSLKAEVRSFLDDETIASRVDGIKSAFQESAERNGATVEFNNKRLAVAYEVDQNEPLIQRYKEVVEKRGGEFKMAETFVASDANALRGEKGLQVFVVSTGAVNEHTVREQVKLSDMEQLAVDLVSLIRSLGT
jgi:tripeptide aminopeptidase